MIYAILIYGLRDSADKSRGPEERIKESEKWSENEIVLGKINKYIYIYIYTSKHIATYRYSKWYGTSKRQSCGDHEGKEK